MLNCAMALYEAKYNEADEWIELSDLEIMDELYKTYMKVTPVIREMIMGNEVETPYGIFRIKLISGVPGGEKSELFAA
jgi:hypothetical protein